MMTGKTTAPFQAQRALTDDYPIVVHSHLGWDWVWQRPQQFLSRLSRRHRVLFVEGPVPTDGVKETQTTLREVPTYPNVLVLQTQIPAERWSNAQWVDKERRRVVKDILAGPLGQHFKAPVQWFYDPMAVTAFAGHLEERAIVYDCMDELSLFRGAPPELMRRERELLAVADVVFAGGPKIGKAKQELNQNCFSYGCGVDVDHFGKARAEETKLPKDVANLPQPIFGYIGVVDERVDYDLLAQLAESTSGSVVIIGPSTKVNPADFPQRSNLVWLGGRDYVDLPAYAKSFDVCLMPFALNDATKFINPTKALEYMATGRPIISTPIEDVMLQFSGVVDIAHSAEDFISLCAKRAARPNGKAISRGLELARKNSWSSIVSRLEGHIQDVLVAKRPLATSAA